MAQRTADSRAASSLSWPLLRATSVLSGQLAAPWEGEEMPIPRSMYFIYFLIVCLPL